VLQIESGPVKSYVTTLEGWLYLAVILNLFSRRVVDWKLGQTLDAELVITALRNALVLSLGLAELNTRTFSGPLKRF